MVLAAVPSSLAGAAALFAYGLVDTVVVIARNSRPMIGGPVHTRAATGPSQRFNGTIRVPSMLRFAINPAFVRTKPMTGC